MNEFVRVNDSALAESHNGIMNANPSLWIVRSKDDSVLSAYEGLSFRDLYDYVEETWPELLRTDSISAMRIR